MASLRALEILVAALESGSLSEAARRLGISQPAASQQLTALEAEVGTALVERLPRGVRATAAGAHMLVEARAAVNAARRAVRVAAEAGEGRRGTLRIGAIESVVAPVLAPVLRDWRRDRRDVRLHVVEVQDTARIIDLLDAGEIDLGVGAEASAWPGVTTAIGREEIHVVLPDDHPLADRTTIPWSALRQMLVVHYAPENSLGTYIDAAAAAHGVVLRPVVRTQHATTAAALAWAGLGVALVPASALAGMSAGIVRPLQPRLLRALSVLIANPSDALVALLAADLARRGAPAAPPS